MGDWLDNKIKLRLLDSMMEMLHHAKSAFYQSIELPLTSGDRAAYEDECEYFLNKTFVNLLIFLELENLPKTYAQLNALYEEIKKEKNGFLRSSMGPDEPYLDLHGILSNYIDSFLAWYGEKRTLDHTKEIIAILRATTYSITDPKIYRTVPASEEDVHLRIESILRCVFPDLIHKPVLSKPIKNFVPDTGIPSRNTLIEYKFITSVEDSKRISDELLADSRGYRSKEWEYFVYVIYETNRIKSENEWKDFFKACGLEWNSEVVVISGEPAKPKGTRTVKLRKTK